MYLYDDDCVALIVRSYVVDEHSQSLAIPVICKESDNSKYLCFVLSLPPEPLVVLSTL